MWLVYSCLQPLMHVALPLAFALFFLRSFKEPSYRQGLASRLGFGPVGRKNSIWIYAASLGETRAASPIVQRLLEEGHTILLTHNSAAGFREGLRLFGAESRVTVRYVPLDLFWAVGIFLRRTRPRAGIVMEIEIWPAMLMEASRAGVPMFLANGNLLEESISRRGMLRRFLFSLYRLFTAIFTRGEEYRQRYIRLGVEPERVHVVGELRYDLRLPEDQLRCGERLRSEWAGTQPVLMIASSVRDEEAGLLELVNQLTARIPDLKTVWVPRSPQRFEAVAAMIESTGLKVLCRTKLGELTRSRIPESTQVLVGDSIGEMFVYYAMSDLVFVGGSLGQDGGHNIVEPMAVGRAVVMGPSIYGVAFAAGEASKVGAFQSLPDLPALIAACYELLLDPIRLSRMGQAAARFAATQTGSAKRTLDHLFHYLEDRP